MVRRNAEPVFLREILGLVLAEYRLAIFLLRALGLLYPQSES